MRPDLDTSRGVCFTIILGHVLYVQKVGAQMYIAKSRGKKCISQKVWGKKCIQMADIIKNRLFNVFFDFFQKHKISAFLMCHGP